MWREIARSNNVTGGFSKFFDRRIQVSHFPENDFCTVWWRWWRDNGCKGINVSESPKPNGCKPQWCSIGHLLIWPNALKMIIKLFPMSYCLFGWLAPTNAVGCSRIWPKIKINEWNKALNNTAHGFQNSLNCAPLHTYTVNNYNNIYRIDERETFQHSYTTLRPLIVR